MDEKKNTIRMAMFTMWRLPRKMAQSFQAFAVGNPVFINPGERHGFMKRVFYAGFAGSRHMWLQRLAQDKYDSSGDISICVTTIAVQPENNTSKMHSQTPPPLAGEGLGWGCLNKKYP